LKCLNKQITRLKTSCRSPLAKNHAINYIISGERQTDRQIDKQ